MIQTIAARLNEWKQELGLTNQKLADLSGVPKQTVDRTLAANVERPSFETIFQLTASMGHTIDELMGAPKPAPEQTKEPQHYDLLLQAYKDQIEQHRNHIIRIEEQYEKERASHRLAIRVLFGCLAALVAFLIFYFVWDITHPGMGLVQYDTPTTETVEVTDTHNNL